VIDNGKIQNYQAVVRRPGMPPAQREGCPGPTSVLVGTPIGSEAARVLRTVHSFDPAGCAVHLSTRRIAKWSGSRCCSAAERGGGSTRCVLGVGNVLQTDEGVGPHAVCELKRFELEPAVM